MKNLLTYILLIVSGATFAQSHKSDTAFFLSADNLTPFSFIDTFKLRSNEKYMVKSMFDNFPEDWVKKENIEPLIQLINSQEKCYCFLNPFSSFIPDDSATVGGYVIEFINSYRYKKKISFGHWSCPKTDKKKADEIIAWWAKEKSANLKQHKF